MKRLWPAILLAWIAGFVDALGYLALAKVFTAHMSGNAAAVGAEMGAGKWHEAMIRGLAIPGFVLGVALGETMGSLSGSRSAEARNRPRRLASLSLELFLLVGFLVLEKLSSGSPAPGTFAYFVRVWLLALAMGVQTSALRRGGGARVRTTFISGMLTKMTLTAITWLFHLSRSSSPASFRDSAASRAVLYGLIVFAFLTGGICGGFGEVRWGSIALVFPMAALLIIIVADWAVSPSRRPEPSTAP